MRHSRRIGISNKCADSPRFRLSQEECRISQASHQSNKRRTRWFISANNSSKQQTLHNSHKSIMSTAALSLVQAASMISFNQGANKQPARKDNGPDKRDVLLGRGRKYSYHPGNVLFCGTILDFARIMLMPDPI
jgi:hypothetical protein